MTVFLVISLTTFLVGSYVFLEELELEAVGGSAPVEVEEDVRWSEGERVLKRDALWIEDLYVASCCSKIKEVDLEGTIWTGVITSGSSAAASSLQTFYADRFSFPYKEGWQEQLRTERARILPPLADRISSSVWGYVRFLEQGKKIQVAVLSYQIKGELQKAEEAPGIKAERIDVSVFISDPVLVEEILPN